MEEKGGVVSRALPATPQLHSGTLLFSSPARSVPSHPASQLSPIRAAPTKVLPFCPGRRPGPPPRGTRPAPAPRRWRALRSRTGHPSSRPPPRPTHTPGRARHPSARGARRERSLPQSPRRKRSEKTAFRKLIGAARARLTQSAPGQNDAGPLAFLPPLEERSVPSALRPKLYPWEKPAPLPLIAQGKKPAPAHPARTGIRKRNPHPAKAKTPPSPSYPRAERSRHFPLFPPSRSL